MTSELANLKSQISNHALSEQSEPGAQAMGGQSDSTSEFAVSDLKSQISNRALAAVILVWLIALPSLIPQGFRTIWSAHDSAASTLPIPLQQTLDPNVAPWYELSALPGIGDSLAKRIIEFRNIACANGAERAFENTADLQQVHGIGPKTAAKLAPFLRFDARCAKQSN